MRFKKRSTRWYAVATALLLTGSIAATKSVAANCSFDAARDWVAAHPDAVPTTLAGVTEFPEAYQRVIMHSLPATARAQIWRDHFAAASRNVRLTDDQKRVLKLVNDSLDVWLAAKVPPATLANDGATFKLIRATFSDSLARQFFVSLGASGKGTMSIRTASMFSAADALFSLATVQAGIRAVFGSGSISKVLAPPPPCSCSGSSSWCGRWGGSEQPCSTWRDCEMAGIGCGTLGMYSCDGICPSEA